MPFLVRVTEGDNPREIAENIDDVTAHDMARNISAATGETVELVPYHYDEKTSTWVLAEEPATTVQITATDDPAAAEVSAPDFEAMTGDELNTYAAAHNIDGYKKSASVADRRAAVVASLPE